MASNLTPPDVVTRIREGSRIDTLRARSDESTLALRITDVFNSLVQAAAAISKYGMITVIFALPLVVACFGLYFLWMAVNGPEANMVKVSVGIFTVVFGSGLLILLLWLFASKGWGEQVVRLTGPPKKQA